MVVGGLAVVGVVVLVVVVIGVVVWGVAILVCGSVTCSCNGIVEGVSVVDVIVGGKLWK